MAITTRSRRAKTQAYQRIRSNNTDEMEFNVYHNDDSEDESSDDEDFDDTTTANNDESTDQVDAVELIPTPESYERAVDDTIEQCSLLMLDHISSSMRESKYEGKISTNSIVRDVWGSSAATPTIIIWQAWSRTQSRLRGRGHTGTFSVDQKGNLCWHIYTKYESPSLLKKCVTTLFYLTACTFATTAILSGLTSMK